MIRCMVRAIALTVPQGRPRIKLISIDGIRNSLTFAPCMWSARPGRDARPQRVFSVT